MTTIGQLRDRIEILRKTGGKDTWGTPLPEGWVSHAKLWSEVLHLSGLSTIKADVDISVVRASFRIRRRTDIDASMRVRFEGREYQIDAVLPGRTREFCDLACKLVT